jgi:hypothetical protein
MKRLRRLAIGNARDPHDPTVFHKISLIAFFAWVGLGANDLVFTLLRKLNHQGLPFVILPIRM